MTICYLTTSDRREGFIQRPLLRPPKPKIDGLSTISAAQFQQLPASEKAGFLLLHENGLYMRKCSHDGRRSEAAAHRLVEAAKSPTQDFELAFARYGFKFHALSAPHVSALPVPGVDVEREKQITPLGQVGCSTVIQFREWSDEYRIRTQVETANTMPPPQAGERLSNLLSSRGAKKIAEACEFMALKKGGFKTFVTGTFNEKTRQAIELGETTIQREVSRCMDALQKMYARGWVTSKGEKVPGHAGGLPYAWVVEIPSNENGEPNPHVHMLLGWSVPYRLFTDWSARIERIWGNGYFHLEKIKDCACAGAYMAKAAGYMTKGEAEGQGRVRGNRYGISDAARAPDWVTLGRSQLHAMGQIIADVFDHLSHKYGEQFRERKRLNKRLAETPKGARWTRQKIGERLQQVRAQLNEIPVRCSRYQIICKGLATAGTFLTWARGERLSRPEWLPDLPAELAWRPGEAPQAKDGHWFRSLRRKFQRIKQWRNAITDEIGAQLVEGWQAARDWALSSWEDYERGESGRNFAAPGGA